MKNKNILHGKQAKDEEIELTLGLSLNGKFGVEPKRATKSLKRSCSAVETTSWGSGEPLSRTSSLPVKNRKELLMVRRREAKRRMLEKQRSNGVVSRKTVVDEDDEIERGECYWSKIVSQRSTGSSGLSDLETQWTPPPNGLNIVTEVKSPQSAQSFSGPNEQATTATHQEAKPLRSISAPTETVKNMLADMPCVSTKGDGPNGERIDGFLYKYKKGEEIKIVCVCHGSFLSPAEFIRHAGGGDVEHPLRHIVVNRSPLLKFRSQV